MAKGCPSSSTPPTPTHHRVWHAPPRAGSRSDPDTGKPWSLADQSVTACFQLLWALLVVDATQTPPTTSAAGAAAGGQGAAAKPDAAAPVVKKEHANNPFMQQFLAKKSEEEQQQQGRTERDGAATDGTAATAPSGRSAVHDDGRERREQRERVIDALVGVINRRAKDLPMDVLALLLWLLSRLPSNRAKKLVPPLTDAFDRLVSTAMVDRRRLARQAESQVGAYHGGGGSSLAVRDAEVAEGASAGAAGAAGAAETEVDETSKAEEGELEEGEEAPASVVEAGGAGGDGPSGGDPATDAALRDLEWLRRSFGGQCAHVALGLLALVEACAAAPFRGGLFISGSRGASKELRGATERATEVAETTGLPTGAIRALESFASLPVPLLTSAMSPSEAVPLLAAYTALGIPADNLLAAIAAAAQAGPSAFHPHHLCALAWAAASSASLGEPAFVRPLFRMAEVAMLARSERSAAAATNGSATGGAADGGTGGATGGGTGGAGVQFTETLHAPMWRAVRRVQVATLGTSASHELAVARLLWSAAALGEADEQALGSVARLLPLVAHAADDKKPPLPKPERSAGQATTWPVIVGRSQRTPASTHALLHQYHLWATRESAVPVARRDELALPPPLAISAAEAYTGQWKPESGNAVASRGASSVSHVLSWTGIPHKRNFVAAGYHIDCAILANAPGVPPPGVRTAVLYASEADHLHSSHTLIPTLQLKLRQLRAAGWAVVAVPHYEWMPLPAPPRDTGPSSAAAKDGKPIDLRPAELARVHYLQELLYAAQAAAAAQAPPKEPEASAAPAAACDALAAKAEVEPTAEMEAAATAAAAIEVATLAADVTDAPTVEAAVALVTAEGGGCGTRAKAMPPSAAADVAAVDGEVSMDVDGEDAVIKAEEAPPTVKVEATDGLGGEHRGEAGGPACIGTANTDDGTMTGNPEPARALAGQEAAGEAVTVQPSAAASEVMQVDSVGSDL